MKRLLVTMAAFGAFSMALTGAAFATANTPPNSYPPPTSLPVSIVSPTTPTTTPITDQIVLGNALYAPCVIAATIDSAGARAESNYNALPAPQPPAAVIVDGTWIPAGVAATYKTNIGCIG
jgi:hypothetical protein